VNHQVFASLPSDLPIKKEDLIFKVYNSDSTKLGELRISRGAVVWYGPLNVKGRKMSWKKFDELMQEHGRKLEQRRPGTRRDVSAAKRKRY
jgi:hypothetical protein